ncbi:hypothetical protein D3Y59_09730 [Hymenobacter oligotrophus]|uniref:DUF4230 domain-containing protein n=1 Tax=Hymenobacter oligotrophus TaxID=2319843 RepID=A0A3B7RT60_9BACT|nr:hypothetical protein [Hymenobacter oligotrophus]AYA37307.1 hypothetical protein D3Y59_09730 [Hymenobacter oligotrophus]
MIHVYRRGRASALRSLCAVLFLVGIHTSASAQAGLIVGLVRAAVNVTLLATADTEFARKGKGSYQLEAAAGSWQTGKLLLTNNLIEVEAGKEDQRYSLGELRQAVIGTDTFAVVHSVQFPPSGKDKRPVPPTTVLGRRTWRRPQVELFEFASAGGMVPVLRFPNQKALALPTQRKEFQQAMQAVVADHPVLSQQLQSGQLDATHTRAILDAYLRNKPDGFNTTAIFAQ